MSKKIINGDDLRKQLENLKPNLKQISEEMMVEWLNSEWCSCEQKATLDQLKAAHEKLAPFLPLLCVETKHCLNKNNPPTDDNK